MKTARNRIIFRCMVIFFSVVSLFGFVTGNRVACSEASTLTNQNKGGKIMVGDFEVTVLSDGINKRPVEQQLQLLQGDKDQIKNTLSRSYPDGQMESTVNAFLINTGSKLILVDTGNGKSGSPSMGHVIDNLVVAGYQPENVDEIYLTHMHPDHVGGLVVGAERAFPNAMVYANAVEAEYWLSDSNMEAAPDGAKRTYQAAKTAIAPYMNADKFKTFAGNVSLTPGIRAEATVGHTPGHTIYFIESKGETLVLCGDLIHVAEVQFEDPTITIAYDSDKVEAAKTRQQIFAEAAKNNWLVGGAHLAFPAIGHIRTNQDKGYIFSSRE